MVVFIEHTYSSNEQSRQIDITGNRRQQ